MTFRAFKFYLTHPIIFIRRIGNFFYELAHPDEPWLAPKAVRFLDNNLGSEMKLFEWGSGRSTLWFSERVKKVVSIEYHEGWSHKVKKMIEDKGAQNVDLRYIPLDHPIKDPTPKHYDPIPKYVSEIFKFDKGYFDVIIIDGHYRLTCADKCLEYLSENGYLVIDNSNRETKSDWGVPTHWPLLHESENVMTQTSIWMKKSQ